MTKRPRILITNDDGINAQGLHHLWKALCGRFDLVVCAPAKEQSAVGLSITIREPLRVEKMHWQGEGEVWSVTGTPADCIKMALHKFFPTAPDLIISGINRGSNAGRNVLYSGTVAGVIEGALRGIPGIAVSCTSYHQPNYAEAATYVPTIVDHLFQHPLNPGTFLNVNFPQETPKGIRLTRQGKEYWMDSPDERVHPAEGHSYFWLGIKVAQFEEHEDSDIAWLRDGYVTAVPLQVNDLTDHQALNDYKHRFNDLSF